MTSLSAAEETPGANGGVLPRVTIQFCTQCKWMLRAAYYAQELLSTFSLSLGEVALQPSTGGTFIVTIYTPSTTLPGRDEAVSAAEEGKGIRSQVLWDRKVDGGFPETKELKRRVRDVIDPARDLGHVDGRTKQQQQQQQREEATASGLAEGGGGKDLSAAAGGGSAGDSCQDCA